MAKAKYTKSKDGKWYAYVWDGTYTATGAKKRKKLSSSKSSGDLEKKVFEFNRTLKENEYVKPSHYSVLEYSRHWFITYKAIRELNTRKMYENIIEKHLSMFSTVRLQDFQRFHIQMLINKNSEQPRTCEQIMLTIKQVIKSAISDKIIPPTALLDLTTGISLPKKNTKSKKRPLTKNEIQAIKTADFLPNEKAYVLILYGCGLRREEALALMRSDINLVEGTLRVERAVVFDVNDPIIKSPKTHNGYRTIPMPDWLTSYLKEYIPTLKTDYLFTTRDELITKSSFNKMWRRILKKMNLEADEEITRLTSHIFRHNYCSNLCYQVPKISIKKIASLMGDTEKMVLDVYNHLIEEKENTTAAISEAFKL